ncbi:MAG: UDP-N-acetylmuramoyl-L-alanine--D-glutamate ligase [Thiolinea sp.]
MTAMAAYAAAKARIYQHCQHPVLNRDDAAVMQMMAGLDPASCYRFSLVLPPESDRDFAVVMRDGQRVLVRGERVLAPLSALRLPGEHNAANALAALALGSVAGLPEDAMLQALQDFPGLPHRTEWVRERAGVNWYNDSKGTNVGAAVAALQGLPGKTVLIAGGQGKGADFAPLAPVIAEYARAVVLMGEDAGLIAAQVPEQVPSCRVESMDAAVALAAEWALPGDNVLLSPACASFDMFNNYMHRGELFAAAVRRLPE